ncbi:MAG: helix-turn-helix domain-containing protein [Candidatus Binatia bacterium]
MNNEHLNGAAQAIDTTRPSAGGIDAPLAADPLSAVIRGMRQQLHLTQEELAQALGITVGTVSRWEKGRFRPSRLARALILEYARTHNVHVELKSTGRH